MADSGEELLDIKQAAQFLRVSETSLRRWTNAGLLASLRVGGRRERRFRLRDLVDFMEHHPGRQAGRQDPTVIGAEAPQVQVGGVSLAVGAHLAGLYDTDHGRAAQAAQFLADGLRPGTVCVILARIEHQACVLDLLQQASGAPIQDEIAAGRLILSEYFPDIRPQIGFLERGMLGALRQGASSIRLVGDVGSGPLGQGSSGETFTRYENEYHHAIARRFPVVTLCQYDARLLSGVDVLAVYRCHSENFSIPAERLLS